MHYRILKRQKYSPEVGDYVMEYWTGNSWERESAGRYRPAFFERKEAGRLRNAMGDIDIFLVDPVMEQAKIDIDKTMAG